MHKQNDQHVYHPAYIMSVTQKNVTLKMLAHQTLWSAVSSQALTAQACSINSYHYLIIKHIQKDSNPQHLVLPQTCELSCCSCKGTFINDVQHFLAIFDLPTLSDDFYPTTSNIWGLFWTPLPTLKQDVIYGRFLMYINYYEPILNISESMVWR